jgi:diaminopimelate decarboxylase
MVEVSYRPLTTGHLGRPQILSEQEALSLAEKFGTPFYVIDESTLRRKLSDLETSFQTFSGPVRVAYSVKSNFNPELLKIFVKEKILFDLTSTEELFFLLKCSGDPASVIYTSISESLEEYSEILEKRVRRIVVSSFNGLRNLISAARKTKTLPSALIRVNPEVGVKAEVRASYRHGKFGVPFNGGTVDSGTNLVRTALNSSEITLEGFHFHLGSQIADPTCFANALEKLGSFISKVRKEFPNLNVDLIDIGGGTPVFYGNDPVPSPRDIGQLVCGKLNSLSNVIGGRFTLVVESGRYLSAEACALVSKIVNKKSYEENDFIIVDAGYHLLLDAALLRQEYPQEVVPANEAREQEQQTRRRNLVGRLCDTVDVFPISKSSNLSGADVGKLVVFSNVGAYSIVFNMPFHCQTKPPVFVKRFNNTFELVRKRQTVEQLFEEETA